MQAGETNVVILGAGRIGKTLGRTLKHRGVRVDLWDVKRGLVARQKPLSETVPGADFVFLCLPSWGYRAALKRLKPHMPRRTIIVSFAKGIEPTLQTTVDAVVKKTFPRNPLVVFGGPMLAEQIRKDSAGAGVAASAQREPADRVIGLFSDTAILLEYSPDVFGTAIAGVLKNVYSIAFGVAEGLGWNDNARGWLFAKALGEMVCAGTFLGGQRETIEGLAGAGDFAACVMSPHSRHHRSGVELSRTGACGIRSEGMTSVPLLARMLVRRRTDFPVLFALAEAIRDGGSAREVFAKLAPWGRPVYTE